MNIKLIMAGMFCLMANLSEASTYSCGLAHDNLRSAIANANNGEGRIVVNFMGDVIDHTYNWVNQDALLAVQSAQTAVIQACESAEIGEE